LAVCHAFVFAAAVTHGNMRLPEWLEPLLQPVVITLDLHLIHHSIVYDEASANFGAVLSV
jgi:sterol desaturase/sphingolipid hydroxylase (fatty acid hydroxylase superfamily)